ncbi:hypothetical protein Abr02nite_68000 [Paractinoplanes brasiliensis]|nr:hypothetical protein Abr02nite_68000 [Actinoplanes brasiliensis]
MAIHTQAEMFNQDLRQTRFGAAPAPGVHGGSSVVRLSEVSSAAVLLSGDRRPRARPQGWAFRVDETGTGEYSPPTAAIVSYRRAQRHSAAANRVERLGPPLSFLGT